MAKVGSRDCRRWLDESSLHINAARDAHRSRTPFGLGIVFQVALRAHLTTAGPGCHGVSSRTLRLHQYGSRPVGNVCGSSRPPPGHPFWQVTDARGMFSYSPKGWCLSGTDRGVGVTLLFSANYDMYASSRAAVSLVTGWISGGAEARLRCSFCLRQGRYVVHLLYRWLIWKSRGTKVTTLVVLPRYRRVRLLAVPLWSCSGHRTAQGKMPTRKTMFSIWTAGGSGSGFLLPEAGYSWTTTVAGLVRGGSAPESRIMLGASGLCDEVMDTTTPDRHTSVTKV